MLGRLLYADPRTLFGICSSSWHSATVSGCASLLVHQLSYGCSTVLISTSEVSVRCTGHLSAICRRCVRSS